jgi:hypothetical protein
VTDARLAGAALEVAYTSTSTPAQVAAAALEVAYTSTATPARVAGVALEVATGTVFGTAAGGKRGWGILR